MLPKERSERLWRQIRREYCEALLRLKDALESGDDDELQISKERSASSSGAFDRRTERCASKDSPSQSRERRSSNCVHRRQVLTRDFAKH